MQGDDIDIMTERASAADYPRDFASSPPSSIQNNGPQGQLAADASAASEDDLANFWDDVVDGHPGGSQDVAMAGADSYAESTLPGPSTPLVQQRHILDTRPQNIRQHHSLVQGHHGDSSSSPSSGMFGSPDQRTPSTEFFISPLAPATPTLAPGTKRKAGVSNSDTNTRKKPRTVDVDLTQNDQSTPPLLSAWHTAGQDSADHREFLANKDEIDRQYTVGDKHRTESDSWENKLRWLKEQRTKDAKKAQRQAARKQKQQHTVAAPAPAPAPVSAQIQALAPAPQVAQPPAVPARRQGARYAKDLVNCPVLGSRELEHYPLLGDGSGRYRCLHYDRHLCGTPQCPIFDHRHCCREGYTKERLEQQVEQHETRDRRKIERLIQAGKLDPRHKTWTGWYSEKLARKFNEQHLFVHALEWTTTGEKREQWRQVKMAQPLPAPQPAPAAPASEQEEQEMPSPAAKEAQSGAVEAPSSPESLRQAATQAVLGQMKVKRLARKRALTAAEQTLVGSIDVATVLKSLESLGFDKVVGMVAKELERLEEQRFGKGEEKEEEIGDAMDLDDDFFSIGDADVAAMFPEVDLLPAALFVGANRWIEAEEAASTSPSAVGTPVESWEFDEQDPLDLFFISRVDGTYNQ
jgi:hypothetical protein